MPMTYKALKPSLLACLLISCSFSSDLVVSNNSAQPVTVTYTLKNPLGLDDPETDPAVAEDPSGPWESMSVDAFAVSPDRRTVTLVVRPNQSVRVAKASGYDGPRPAALDYFPIVDMRIQGAAGEVLAKSPVRAMLAFKHRKSRLFVCSYPVASKTASQELNWGQVFGCGDGMSEGVTPLAVPALRQERRST